MLNSKTETLPWTGRWYWECIRIQWRKALCGQCQNLVKMWVLSTPGSTIILGSTIWTDPSWDAKPSRGRVKYLAWSLIPPQVTCTNIWDWMGWNLNPTTVIAQATFRNTNQGLYHHRLRVSLPFEGIAAVWGCCYGWRVSHYCLRVTYCRMGVTYCRMGVIYCRMGVTYCRLGLLADGWKCLADRVIEWGFICFAG